MPDTLNSHFVSELESWSDGNPLHSLTYTDRQLLKAERYAEVAEQKLPALDREIWWNTMSVRIAVFLLIGGALLSALLFTGVVPAEISLQAVAFPLFFAFSMGLSAMWAMQKRITLEKMRLLCKLVRDQRKERREGVEHWRREEDEALGHLQLEQ